VTEREYLIERRRALLIELKAIEKRLAALQPPK
jgi:hypothetical protein